MKCAFCLSEINPRAQGHIYACAPKHGFAGSRDAIKLHQLEFSQGHSLSKEWVEDRYIAQQWSLPDFLEQAGLSYQATKFLLKLYGIKARSLSEARKTSRALDKFATTSIDRFGHTNPSSAPAIKEQRTATVQAKFGAPNVRQSAWFKESHAALMQARYGVGSLPNRFGRMQAFWDSKSEEEKKLHMLAANIAYKDWLEALTEEERIAFFTGKAKPMLVAGRSRLELLVEDALITLGLPYVAQFWLNRRSYDFLLKGTKLLLEVQGDYWHANPAVYAPDSLLNYPWGQVTAEARWQQDAEKAANAAKYGFLVIPLWEADILAKAEILSDWLEGVLNEHYCEA